MSFVGRVYHSWDLPVEEYLACRGRSALIEEEAGGRAAGRDGLECSWFKSHGAAKCSFLPCLILLHNWGWWCYLPPLSQTRFVEQLKSSASLLANSAKLFHCFSFFPKPMKSRNNCLGCSFLSSKGAANWFPGLSPYRCCLVLLWCIS